MVNRTPRQACGTDPGNLCEWVYERTDNEALAEFADWFVSRPLQILLILLGAWIAARLARRYVTKAVRRVVAPDREAAAKHFRRLGIAPPPMLTAEVKDPRRETRAAVISTVVAGSAMVVIWTIALITVLGRLGVDLGPLIAGAGIAGVALGFGAQSLVKDWLAGIFMLLEDQFGIGDVVDLGEASGVVERVSLRVTVLRSLDGTVWHVPNGEVQRVGNLSQLWSVALVDVDVPQDADLDTVKPAVLEAANAVVTDPVHAETVLEAPQLLGVEAITPDAITLRLLVKTVPSGQWALQRALREAIKRRLAELGISAPIPGLALWSRIAARPPVKPGAASDEQQSDS
jgi:moderate conductance mechanosensitive channel